MEAAEKTIVRKPCRSCGRSVDLDLTEELENAERAWKEGRPGRTRTEILAASATCSDCVEKASAETITKRVVTRVLVYEIPADSEPETIPADVVERFLDVYENGLGVPEEEGMGAKLLDTKLLGSFRVEATAPTAGGAITAVSEALSENWNKLAASVGLAETEIVTTEGEDDGD